MKNIRLLIVEDDKNLRAFLKASYRSIFESRDFHVTIEEVETVDDARRLAKAAKAHPYDIVSLDVNLGDATMTGLDVLETLKRFQSSWMVALLTGVETDSTLDKTMGKARGEGLRKQLRRDAYARFPAERLLVVEKPGSTIPATEAEILLENRLKQIVAVYEEVSRLRYIFRPIVVVSRERVPVAGQRKRRQRQFVDVSSTHWQIRFNCGDMRTLPDWTWFKTLHHLLSVDSEVTLSPEEALAIEPRIERRQQIDLQVATGGDPIAQYFNERGIAWSKFDAKAQDDLIRVALGFQLKRYIELRGFQDEGGLEPSEEDELCRLKAEFGPLAGKAEEAYEGLNSSQTDADAGMEPGVQAQNELHGARGNYDREQGRWGEDSPEAKLFRARKKRACDYLRENGFVDFAEHIEGYVQSTGANWSYNPPTGVEWTV